MEDEMKKFQEEQEKLIREREKRKAQEAKLKAKEEAKEQELKEQKPKDGITVLKEVGLKNVSNKTFINLENLTNLLNKDFEKLHKTKALGFIQILEREFKVDLHELREDYLSYTNGSRRINEKKSIPAKATQKNTTKKRVRDSKKIIQESNKSSFKIGPYLLLLLAGVAGYFLLKSGTSDEDKITATDLNISQSKVVEDEPKNSLLAQAVKEESNQTKNEAVDEDDDLNKIVQKMLKNSQDIESNQSSQNSTVQQTMQEESNLSTTQEQIVSSNNNDLENALKKQSTDLESIEKSVDEVNLSNRAKESEEKALPKVKEEVPVVKKESEKVANIPNNLYLVPKQRAWVGVIYLDDYTKKDYLIRGKLKLDPNRDQLILVGHNKIKIYKDSKQFKVHSKKKARFIYENGELREISKQEYKERSAGVRW